MAPGRGKIVLMGSGELTSTMVEVHKEILKNLEGERKAVFLDTPAGFQLNVDELSQRAVDYFRSRVLHPLSVLSFKAKDISPFEAEQAFQGLREASYVLVGPGSPTYAVRQWVGTPVADILAQMTEKGGCFVAASAAALTVGRFTLPVYEIYKVGEPLYWAEGLNLLDRFGLNYVVIPHWNNAEGGTHDTRCCFVGESRFRILASMLPEETAVLGIDEHTACIIDFEKEKVTVRGIGSVTVRRGDKEKIFQRDVSFPLDILRGKDADTGGKGDEKEGEEIDNETVKDMSGGFWGRVHAIESAFHRGIESDPRDAVNAILELDRVIWEARQNLENVEFITQAREMLREHIVLMGARLVSEREGPEHDIRVLIEELLVLRESFRKNKQWRESDALRDCLRKVNVLVEDTPEGPQWQGLP